MGNIRTCKRFFLSRSIIGVDVNALSDCDNFIEGFRMGAKVMLGVCVCAAG